MSTLLLGGAVACCIALATAVWAWQRERQRCRLLADRLDEALARRAEDQSALSERQELDRLKDEFISTVSHELRTPLTSIRGALGLLSAGVTGQVDDKAQNLLRIAHTNTERLVRLINDILDLQRMDSGRSPLHLRRCSLPEMVAQAVDTMRSMAEAAEVRIDVVPARDTGAGDFEGDPDRMQQVLCNLLSNAIKFSPQGGTVRLTHETKGSDLLLRIEDRGRGVPADKLESIFDRFSQVAPGDARQKGGTGLGLAISRAIVTQHHGAVWMERNDAGGGETPGVTQCVRLPRMEAASEQDGAAAVTRGTVLVADDDSGVRHVVAELLRRNGYSVVETESGMQALEIASDGGVDVILLDLSMPGVTGWEMLERLKGDPATAAIPVVVLSVLGPAAHGAEGLSTLTSTHGWVRKPYDEGLLLSTVERALHAGAAPLGGKKVSAYSL